jgi:hypothetical protein
MIVVVQQVKILAIMYNVLLIEIVQEILQFVVFQMFAVLVYRIAIVLPWMKIKKLKCNKKQGFCHVRVESDDI